MDMFIEAALPPNGGEGSGSITENRDKLDILP